MSLLDAALSDHAGICSGQDSDFLAAAQAVYGIVLNRCLAHLEESTQDGDADLIAECQATYQDIESKLSSVALKVSPTTFAVPQFLPIIRTSPRAGMTGEDLEEWLEQNEEFITLADAKAADIGMAIDHVRVELQDPQQRLQLLVWIAAKLVGNPAATVLSFVTTHVSSGGASEAPQ